jgi:hypothetical protein
MLPALLVLIMQGVVADGGKLVDRWTVYNKQTTDSHFMALAVKPAADASDTGDFHFWKLDADKTWSYKVRGKLLYCAILLAQTHAGCRHFPYSHSCAVCTICLLLASW